MRISKGLENIHAVIERHESEWREENGLPPELEPSEIAGTVDKQLEALNEQFVELAPTEPEDESETHKIQFSGDRFSGGSTEPVTPEPEPEPDNEPEAVEVISNKDGKHSWLYNEVMKAINDAAKGTRAKIVAVFIPVVQNGREFEDLPADETVTISPVDVSLTKIEPSEILPTPEDETPEIESSSEEFNIIPDMPPEEKAEIAETFREMEEKLEEESAAEETVEQTEPEETENVPAEDASDEPLPETNEFFVEPAQDEDTQTEETEVVTDELTPEVVVAEAEPEVVVVAEEEEPAPEIPAVEAESESESVPETNENANDEEEDDDDDIQDGEPMPFQELETVGENESHELVLTDELDDDNVFDESLVEVQRADDDDEIEIIPDPKEQKH